MAKLKKKSLLRSSRGSSVPTRSVSGKKAKKIKRIIKPVKNMKILIGKKRKFKKVKRAMKRGKKNIIKTKKKISIKTPFRHILRRVKKQSVKNPAAGFSAESLFKAKIKVIGIGGGGGSIVSEIGKSLEKATFVIADTDIRALKKKSGIKYFWFGQDLTHGLGTGVNVELARQAAESAKEKISGFFKDQDIIIFVASLGGGLGSGATQVFADVAKDFGGITFGIFTMPFKFEGKNKYRIAQNALKSLRKSLNVSLVIPNEKIFKIIDTSTPITNAFSTVNKSLIESLESLIDLIYNPGIINIDFADLRTILRGMGNSAFLNTVEESGKDRVEKICEKVFKNPLLQNNIFKAEKILFNISGGENLSMFEVEKISSHISNLNPKAKIIFGISKNFKLKNRIKTTILTTGAPLGLQVKEEIVKVDIVKEVKPVDKVFAKETKEVKIIKSAKNKKIPRGDSGKAKKPVSFIPVFKSPSLSPLAPALEQKKIEISQVVPVTEDLPSVSASKKTIRRSGLEIKKAEELQEKKRIAQEKEWEIPTFLRKIKFKS